MLLRNCFKKSKYLFGFIPFSVTDNDNVPKDSKSVAFYNEAKEGETGWNRLYAMFSIDEFGAVSPELNSVYQASFIAMFTGGCIGGFVKSRIAYIDFMERNNATSFKTHLEAKKKLQDHVTVNFAKGAFQWGWRLGLFSGSYVLLTTAISVYRGRSSILEYAVAGGLTGGLYKMSLGMRGVVVGAALGTVLGTVAGGASLAILYLTGTSMEEVRFWQQGWKQARDRQILISSKQALESKEDPLIRHHEEKVAAVAGKGLESLEVPPGT